MMHRCATLFLVAMMLALFLSSVALAEDKTHEGKFMQAAGGKLTMTFKGDDKKQTHDLARDAVISLDGRPAKVEDLKEGFLIKVTVNDKGAVTKIEARSKE